MRASLVPVSVVVIVVSCAVAALLGGARCADGAAAECPDVATLCPALTCTEQAVNDDGCPVCECERQACLIDDDCEARVPPQRCDTRFDVCEPPPGCIDDNEGTPCGAACFGLCVPRGEVSTGEFCLAESECAADESCRFNDDFCLIDDVDHPGQCVGWCVSGCDDAPTCGFYPRTQQTFKFNDTCVPPGFEVVPCG